MTRGIAWLSVVALFVAGVSIGALGMRLYDEKTLDRHPHRPPFGGRGPLGYPRVARFMDELNQELQLTDEQREQVQAIVEQSRSDAESLRREMRPKLMAHMERTRAEIMEVLTPEQRQVFSEFSPKQQRMADRYFLGEGRWPRRRP